MRTQHLLRQKQPREQGQQRLQRLLRYRRLLVPLRLVQASLLLLLVPGLPLLVPVPEHPRS